MNVFFYVQHLLGIGHLARATLIADALVKSGAGVTMVLGGMPVSGFPGPGTQVLQLPPVAAGKEGFADLVDDAGQPIDDTFRSSRRKQLLDAFESVKPDVLLVEAYPFGRRQMRFELIPLLEAAEALPARPLIACSLRDILQHRAMKRHRETVDIANEFFDAILVHGDPRLVRLEETFPLVCELASEVVYTGIVSQPPGVLQGASHDVIVSAGGGIVGGELMRCALAAKPDSVFAGDSWCFLIGPNFNSDTRRELEAHSGNGVTVEQTRPDFRALLRAAKVSISQAGYNTVADILQAGCRSLLIPFAQGGESEQSLRAERLAKLGAVSVLSEADLTPESVANALASTAGEEFHTPELDLDGADRTARSLRSLYSRK